MNGAHKPSLFAQACREAAATAAVVSFQANGIIARMINGQGNVEQAGRVQGKNGRLEAITGLCSGVGRGNFVL